MGRLYIGLLHYPVRDREGKQVASALTPLDIPDVARSACTYGVARTYVVQPLRSQREIAEKLLRFWLADVADRAYRRAALQGVRVVATLEDSLADVLAEEGVRPLLVGTSARELGLPRLSYAELRRHLQQEPRPVYLLFGTAWGIADELLERLDAMLPPVRGPGPYNHLSVRAAVAIILDRLCAGAR